MHLGAKGHLAKLKCSAALPRLARVRGWGIAWMNRKVEVVVAAGQVEAERARRW